MATTVFGAPVTNETLKAFPNCPKEITRFDRARVALELKNAENKHILARQYLDKLKKNFGYGVSTKSLVYNATGEPLNFVTHHDWLGRVHESPYPQELQNGQWGAFLHTKTPGAASTSSGAVVYRIKGNDIIHDLDCLLGWCNAWGPLYSNHAFAQFREADGFYGDWKFLERKMKFETTEVEESFWRLFEVKVGIGEGIGEGTTVEFEAELKLCDHCKIDLPFIESPTPILR